MKVSIINYTQNARELLIFSKKTRLKMSPDSFDEIMAMPDEQKQKELDYVFGTIGSSWEFADYCFLIEGVTRAFTHQLVRHRVGVSFAQQAQRVVDMSDFEYLETGLTVDNPVYKEGMKKIAECYVKLLDSGVNPQDARGILPTNILTNILMKINLRSLSGLLDIRLCYKAQGEFQKVALVMRDEVLKIHPWANKVLAVNCVRTGVCAFENYQDCPVKKSSGWVEPNKKGNYEVWSNNYTEVQPKGA